MQLAENSYKQDRYYILNVTLNVNGLNIAIKIQTVLEWIKKKTKQDPSIRYQQETHFTYNESARLKVIRRNMD